MRDNPAASVQCMCLCVTGPRVNAGGSRKTNGNLEFSMRVARRGRAAGPGCATLRHFGQERPPLFTRSSTFLAVSSRADSSNTLRKLHAHSRGLIAATSHSRQTWLETKCRTSTHQRTEIRKAPYILIVKRILSTDDQKNDYRSDKTLKEDVRTKSKYSAPYILQRRRLREKLSQFQTFYRCHVL